MKSLLIVISLLLAIVCGSAVPTSDSESNDDDSEFESDLSDSNGVNPSVKIDLKGKHGILVPAYFPMWKYIRSIMRRRAHFGEFAPLIKAAARLKERLIVVVNMASGPLSERQHKANPGLRSSFFKFIEEIHKAGGIAIGYVSTIKTNRKLWAVKQDVELWYSYKTIVDGIFFDEVAPGGGHYSYSELYKYVQDKANKITGNKGLVVLNPGDVPNWGKELLDEGDIVVVRENYANTPRKWNTPDWVKQADSSRSSCMIHHATDYKTEFKECAANNVGWFYSTDTEWNSLTSYWDQIVELIY